MGINAYNDILKRQAARKAIRKCLAELPTPLITDEDAIKEHAKSIQKLRSAYLDCCSFVDWDIDVLRRAISNIVPRDKDIENLVGIAQDEVPLDAKLREKLEKAEADDAKKTGDVPGQTKLDFKSGKGKVKDDGATAEAAGPVKTGKLA